MDTSLAQFCEELRNVSEDRLALLASFPRNSCKSDMKARPGDEFFFDQGTTVRVDSEIAVFELKIYFSPSEIKSCLTKVVENPSEEMTIGFAMEYCNVVAGIINGALGKINVDTKRTRPDSYNKDSFSDAVIDESFEIFKFQWRVYLNESPFLCKLVVHHKDTISFESITLLDDPDDAMIVV